MERIHQNPAECETGPKNETLAAMDEAKATLLAEKDRAYDTYERLYKNWADARARVGLAERDGKTESGATLRLAVGTLLERMQTVHDEMQLAWKRIDELNAHVADLALLPKSINE